VLRRGQSPIAQGFERARAGYNASRPSRFIRRRTGLGGSGDAHYTGAALWSIREQCRDMVRNDPLAGLAVEKAVTNIVRKGFRLEPTTGDEALNLELKARWKAWSEDAAQCEVTGRHTFHRLERLILRERFVDGDIFALKLDGGRLQIQEGDRVQTPGSTRRNVVHGVLLNDFGAPIEYWFAKPAKDRARQDRVQLVRDVDKIPARDEDGEPNVLHIFNEPERVTLTRGIPIFAPIFEYLGMLEDVNFAKLIQQQVVSCVAAFIEQESDVQLGEQEVEGTGVDGTEIVNESIPPGALIRLGKGESIKGFSPQVPNDGYFEQLTFLLRVIFARMGITLAMALFDTSNTTFHGYRGELAQARYGFEIVQADFASQLHSPVYEWQAQSWLAELGVAARDNPRVLEHEWTFPTWDSVKPLDDRKADALALKTLQASPREIANARGRNHADAIRELCEDNAHAIASGHLKAEELQAQGVKDVTWRDVVFLTTQGAAPADEPVKEEEEAAA